MTSTSRCFSSFALCALRCHRVGGVDRKVPGAYSRTLDKCGIVRKCKTSTLRLEKFSHCLVHPSTGDFFSGFWKRPCTVRNGNESLAPCTFAASEKYVEPDPSVAKSETDLHKIQDAPTGGAVENYALEEGVGTKWRKKKVAMWIGYVGTAYRGLQFQASCPLLTIEGVVEKALFDSNFIRESNYGDLSKIGWTRSSRTDKGVHSSATVISFKMEVPHDAWNLSPDGQNLAEAINQNLPANIRVFSVVPVTGSFSARRTCISRGYYYFIPSHILGINENSNPQEVDIVLKKFKQILSLFEGRHPFHNYTIRRLYSAKSSNRKSGKRKNFNSDHTQDPMSSSSLEGEERRGYGEESEREEEDVDEIEEEEGKESGGNAEMEKIKKAYWVRETNERDKITSAHFRTVLKCDCEEELERKGNLRFLRVHLVGDSFMMHQIRKIVATAVAVLRGWLEEEIIPISLARHSRVTLPLAPSQTLMLSSCEFYAFRTPFSKKQEVGLEPDSSRVSPGNPKAKKLELDGEAKIRADAFVATQILPSIEPFLDGKQEPWREWISNLEEWVGISHEEMDEVQRDWESWKSRRPTTWKDENTG